MRAPTPIIEIYPPHRNPPLETPDLWRAKNPQNIEKTVSGVKENPLPTTADKGVLSQKIPFFHGAPQGKWESLSQNAISGVVGMVGAFAPKPLFRHWSRKASAKTPRGLSFRTKFRVNLARDFWLLFGFLGKSSRKIPPKNPHPNSN